MKLVVGLGNPGKEYQNTRHNLGFRVLDELVASSKYHVSWEESKKFKSSIIKAKNLIFVKPLTFMNNSGMAVRLLTDYYKLQSTDVIIVYDELDLPLGEVRVRQGGSSAGHHGVESIIAALGTDQFIRVRLGVGPATVAAEKFVLESFKSTEKPQVKHMIKQAVKAIDSQLVSL